MRNTGEEREKERKKEQKKKKKIWEETRQARRERESITCIILNLMYGLVSL